MTESEILATARAFERVFITMFCGMSVYLGYRLFQLGVTAIQAGKLEAYGWKIQLTKVGPGIFFALFGMIGLSVATLHSFTYTADGRSVSSLGGGEAELVKGQIKALNTVLHLAMDHDKIGLSVWQGDLDRAKPMLETLRAALARQAFSPARLDEWDHYKTAYGLGQVSDQALNERLRQVAVVLEEPL